MKKLLYVVVVIAMVLAIAPVVKNVFYHEATVDIIIEELEERGCKNINAAHAGDEYLIDFVDGKFHVFANIDDDLDEITKIVKIDETTGKVAYTYEYVPMDYENLFQGVN